MKILTKLKPTATATTNKQQQTSGVFDDSSDDSMDWKTTKSTIAYDQNEVQKWKENGISYP